MVEIVIGKLYDPLTSLLNIDYDILSITISNAVNGRQSRDTFTFDLLTGQRVEPKLLEHCSSTITFVAKRGYGNKHPAILLKKYLSSHYLKLKQYKFTELTMLNNSSLYNITHKYESCDKNIEYSMERYKIYLEQYSNELSQDRHDTYVTIDQLSRRDLEDLERGLNQLGINDSFFADMASLVRTKRKG